MQVYLPLEIMTLSMRIYETEVKKRTAQLSYLLSPESGPAMHADRTVVLSK